MKAGLIGCKDAQLRDRVAEVVGFAGMEPVRTSAVKVRADLRQRNWDVIVFGWDLDDDVGGLEALAEAKRILPGVPVLILSPFPDLAYARRASALGVFDYIEVPFTNERLLDAINAALPQAEIRDPLEPRIRESFVGQSREAAEVVRQIVRYAKQTDCDVLITGETGTGKEMTVRAIHEHSGRKDEPLVAENCANFKGLDVSELFGHVKGAFTGAESDHRGAFERTGRGTLFLDEVQYLTQDTQGQLLRVIETRRFRRVGDEKELEFRGRIIYAMNQDPVQTVAEGRLWEDLFHRISGHRLHLPPLRERPDDITPLAEHFLQNLAGDRPLRLSRPVIVLLNEYHYPGNVRELRNIMAHAVLECAGAEILARHVLPRLDAEARGPAEERASPERRDLFALELKEAAARLEQEYCRHYLPWILQACNNNLTQAALKAGIDPKTFRRKWEECGLPKLSTR